MVPLNLAAGVEPTAAIVLKLAGKGAMYTRCVEMEEYENTTDDEFLLQSAFACESRYVSNLYSCLINTGDLTKVYSNLYIRII